MIRTASGSRFRRRYYQSPVQLVRDLGRVIAAFGPAIGLS